MIPNTLPQGVGIREVNYGAGLLSEPFYVDKLHAMKYPSEGAPAYWLLNPI